MFHANRPRRQRFNIIYMLLPIYTQTLYIWIIYYTSNTSTTENTVYYVHNTHSSDWHIARSRARRRLWKSRLRYLWTCSLYNIILYVHLVSTWLQLNNITSRIANEHVWRVGVILETAVAVIDHVDLRQHLHFHPKMIYYMYVVHVSTRLYSIDCDIDVIVFKYAFLKNIIWGNQWNLHTYEMKQYIGGAKL